ncbi:MAG: 30S ribosomal protein S13 [uncultured bacterium]|nr:MAG: 30S ribosomal protein S13 [uncultured bacterium]HBY73331.1 30S ribosomal protein S13 [Candidatus Kerfeldbacteria bacterium]
MARIAGVTLPNEKRIEVALAYLYGVGIPLSKKVLKQAKVNPDTRAKDLTEAEVNTIKTTLDKMGIPVEGDLRRELFANIKRLKEIGSYRGTRHMKRLPARGQSTKTNSRTVRGNKRHTMGSGRKPSQQKT